jgi:hypothetical protein
MEIAGFDAGMAFEKMLEDELRRQNWSMKVLDLKLVIDKKDEMAKISNFLETCNPSSCVDSLCRVMKAISRITFSRKSDIFKNNGFDISLVSHTHTVELKCSREVEQGGMFRNGRDVGKLTPEWYEISVKCYRNGNLPCCTC